MSAAAYKYTIGIPAPENRAVASAISAVLGVNLVRYVICQLRDRAPTHTTHRRIS